MCEDDGLRERLGCCSTENLTLDSGRTLPRVEQSYAMYGTPEPDGSNVVLICHALTGSHHLAGPDVAGLPGAWLNPVLGPGKAIDTRKLCVISVNNLYNP